MKKINNFIIKLNKLILICFFVVFNLCLSIVLNFLSKKIFNNPFTKNTHIFSSFQEEFFVIAIFSPLIETVIFQYLIIEILYDKFKKEIICIISALLFACTHLYNYIYFIFSFIIGLTFAYLYLIGRLKKRGFLYVYSTHLIYNVIVMILKHI